MMLLTTDRMDVIQPVIKKHCMHVLVYYNMLGRGHCWLWRYPVGISFEIWMFPLIIIAASTTIKVTTTDYG